MSKSCQKMKLGKTGKNFLSPKWRLLRIDNQAISEFQTDIMKFCKVYNKKIKQRC